MIMKRNHPEGNSGQPLGNLHHAPSTNQSQEDVYLARESDKRCHTWQGLVRQIFQADSRKVTAQDLKQIELGSEEAAH